MNYKLIDKSLNDLSNIRDTVLKNRGVENINEFIHCEDFKEYGYELLDHMDEAVTCFMKHIMNKSRIHIVVDCDVDGYCSSAMMYKYIKLLDENIKVTYSLHTGKQHGLSNDIVIPEDCELLIIPDAGSNDVEQCERLKEKGIDILILDHHICKKENNHAIVVNNQNCGYPNKNLCGAGIVYKFLKAVDSETWNDYSDKFLDLVALANISDVMDTREIETRHLILKGLNKVRNKAFLALIKKQEFSMKGKVNIDNVQFYITPLINACVRVGTEEDKSILFRSFIEVDEMFKKKKKDENGNWIEVDETIYDRAARFCSNAKVRQDNAVKKTIEKTITCIDEYNLLDNKILFINATNFSSRTLTGLVASKISDIYMRPCLILMRTEDEDGVLFKGSVRNFSYSPVESLINIIESTKKFQLAQGHDNAFGVEIESANVPIAVSECNKILKDTEFKKIYQADFILDFDELEVSYFKEVYDMKIKNIFGAFVKEPLFIIKNLPIEKENCYVMGKGKDTWKISYEEEGFEAIKYRNDKDDVVLNKLNEEMDNAFGDSFLGFIDVVCKLSFNEFKGLVTPQIVVLDYDFHLDVMEG